MTIDPSDIKVGQWVQFSCPSCDFSFWRVWLEGHASGTSTCQMHDMPVPMNITAVENGEER